MPNEGALAVLGLAGELRKTAEPASMTDDEAVRAFIATCIQRLESTARWNWREDGEAHGSSAISGGEEPSPAFDVDHPDHEVVERRVCERVYREMLAESGRDKFVLQAIRAIGKRTGTEFSPAWVEGVWKMCLEAEPDGDEALGAAVATAAGASGIVKDGRAILAAADQLRKAGKGEGSRGGKVIGRTKSGKAIYSIQLRFRRVSGWDIPHIRPHPDEVSYTGKDHADAAAYHRQEEAKARENNDVGLALRHGLAADSHEIHAKWKKT